MTIEILQLCPLLPTLEAALEQRFRVHRGFDAAARDAVTAAHAPAVRAVVTGGHIGLSNDLMARLTALEIVAINGVGFDKVDLENSRQCGVRVTNTPDVLTDDVADLAIGLALALLRRIPQADRHVRDGRWPSGDMPLGRRMSARRFGILGLGRIGRAVARRLEGFDVPIAYSDIVRQEVGYRFCETPLVLAEHCDVFIVAAAAGSGTGKLVDRAILDAIGPDGVLINVSRGALVDEAALVAALAEGRLGGAALDVFADEPNVPAALAEMPNVVLTPHIASATTDTRQSMASLVLANLDAHFRGGPLPTAVA
jgi:lactate dehydrogenase-like 2-hydroxyacid dehydrogenase